LTHNGQDRKQNLPCVLDVFLTQKWRTTDEVVVDMVAMAAVEADTTAAAIEVQALQAQ